MTEPIRFAAYTIARGRTPSKHIGDLTDADRESTCAESLLSRRASWWWAVDDNTQTVGGRRLVAEIDHMGRRCQDRRMHRDSPADDLPYWGCVVPVEIRPVGMPRAEALQLIAENQRKGCGPV